MKLLYCPACRDVQALRGDTWRQCDCGRSGGQYNVDHVLMPPLDLLLVQHREQFVKEQVRHAEHSRRTRTNRAAGAPGVINEYGIRVHYRALGVDLVDLELRNRFLLLAMFLHECNVPRLRWIDFGPGLGAWRTDRTVLKADGRCGNAVLAKDDMWADAVRRTHVGFEARSQKLQRDVNKLVIEYVGQAKAKVAELVALAALE